MNQIQHKKVLITKSPNPKHGAFYMNTFDYNIDNEPKQ